MSNAFSWEAFNKIPLIGIMRNVPQKEVEVLTTYFSMSGLTTLEITMNSPEATETIAALIKSYDTKLNIGAGTVCSMEDLDKALSAGAQFIVTPIADETVVKTCVTNNIPV